MRNGLRVLASVAMVLVCSTVANAGIIDSFGSDTSGKYSTLLIWDSLGNGAPAYGRDTVANQFAPTGGQGATTYFLRNDYTLGIGDTVSIEVIALPTVSDAAGLGFSQSSTSNVNRTGIWMMHLSDGSYATAGDAAGVGAIANFDPSKPATLSLTRIADQTYYNPWSLTYTKTDGTQGSQDGYVWGGFGGSTGTYYFGALVFEGGSNGTIRMDNLATSAVPEPSTLVLASMGLLGLLAYAWRKRK